MRGFVLSRSYCVFNCRSCARSSNIVIHRLTVADLHRFLKAFARKELDLRSFVRANRGALWKTAYFVVAALLFVSAAWRRFSLPQDPLADTDFGYLWPALMEL